MVLGLGLAFERSHVLFWQRLVEVRLDANLATHVSGTTTKAGRGFCYHLDALDRLA
jgi:hypothetical protein